MGHSEFMKSRPVAACDSSTIVSSSHVSFQSPEPPSPPQSPTTVNEFLQEEEPEYKPLATAIHSHLLHEDIGRQVIIVCTSKRRSSAFHKGLDAEDLSDDPWF